MLSIKKFEASWCQPCKMLSAVMDDMTIEYPVTKVDVDEDQAQTAKYGIRGVPTLILLENGQELKRKSGMMTKEELEEFLKV